MGARALLVVVVLGLGCGASLDARSGRSSWARGTAPHGEDVALDLAEADRSEDARIPRWYDPQALTANVREGALRGLEVTAGPLDELTLYDFDLTIAPTGATAETRATTFRLDERVYFQNQTSVALGDLMFRMYANTPPVAVADAPEKLVRGHCVDVECSVDVAGRDVIIVHPVRPIAPGGRLRVVLHVAGTLKPIDASRTTMMSAAKESLRTMQGGGGGASGDYGLLGAGDDILSFGNFYPVLARHTGDKWDLDESTLGDIGPDALSHVRAHVELPSGYLVAASGVVTHDEDAGGRRRLDYAAGCMRDFALFASDKFTSAESLEGDVKVRSYFRTSDRAMGEKVLDVAAWALRDFQRRFGPYPYRELDLVEEALVGGAGGVEFAGLATVASMFYKPSGTTTGDSAGGIEGLLGTLMGSGGNDGPMKASAAEFTTAHEVAHQWWHGIVGSDSRKHPWQDEALAQFSAMLYAEDRYGGARAKREADMNARMGYEMMRMMGQPDGPVDAPAAHQSPLAYGGLVYGKGPYYLVALRKQLGDAAFFVAMRAYVKQYYLGFAPPRALEETMTHTNRKDAAQIAALSRRWLEEAHGDDDLGKANAGSLLAMAGAGAGGRSGAPDMQQLMKVLGGADGNDEMMKLLQPLLGN